MAPDEESASVDPDRRDEFALARRDLSLAYERKTSLCAPFVALLPVSGASVSILATSLGQSTVCSSNPTATRLDELQFDLGEGPCWQAMTSGQPVLTADLKASGAVWPIFIGAVYNDPHARDVGAMFAFPLTVGSLDIGAVDLFTTEVAELTDAEVAEASALANVAAWQVLRGILQDPSEERSLDSDGLPPSPSSRREVHQATGMVLAQLNISAADAALLIRAHAFASGRSVREVATDIVERRLDFLSGERQ